jgi:SAM-dependent methyltransferase
MARMSRHELARVGGPGAACVAWCPWAATSAMVGERMVVDYYASAAGLRAKHERARTDSGRSFPRWALEQLAPAPDPGSAILDAGCGWGRFTWALLDTFQLAPEQIVACDLSWGMLRSLATGRPPRPPLVRATIAVLPFASGSFELVVAAHVLYLVPDLRRSVRELARVLRPDGVLLATTNSVAIDPLLVRVHARALARLGLPDTDTTDEDFTLENGADILRVGFDEIDTHRFEDSATFDGLRDFLDTYLTLGRYQTLPADVRDAVLRTVERLATEELDRRGVLRSDVLMAAFVCRRPKEA